MGLTSFPGCAWCRSGFLGLLTFLEFCQSKSIFFSTSANYLQRTPCNNAGSWVLHSLYKHTSIVCGVFTIDENNISAPKMQNNFWYTIKEYFFFNIAIVIALSAMLLQKLSLFTAFCSTFCNIFVNWFMASSPYSYCFLKFIAIVFKR